MARRRSRAVPRSAIWLACVLVLLRSGHAQQLGTPPAAPVRNECTRETLCSGSLDLSIKLGTRFMLNFQKPTGNFHYEYNWHSRVVSSQDNAVRQAGSVWGLAFLYSYSREPALLRGILRALSFFRAHTITTNSGARAVVYPGKTVGSNGAQALIVLAHVDLLRARPPLSGSERLQLERELRGLLAHLLTQRMPAPGRLVHSTYSADPAARGFGANNPYADGEAALALAKAARHANRTDLRSAAVELAEAGYAAHAQRAREKNRDSAITKGWYQWGSMALTQLYHAGWPETRSYAARVAELAEWMIDVHRTLARNRNTGYAYEGLVSAYRLARERPSSDAAARAHVKKLTMVITRGLCKLTSWQVGHPSFVHRSRVNTSDRRAVGGAQNHRVEPALRVDVTQHQMHAAILAKRFFCADDG